MRRVLVAATVLALAGGCGKPLVDGDLADDWAAMAEAKPKLPAAGCHDPSVGSIYTTGVIRTQAIPCEQPHTMETIHVGQFPATVAAPPAAGTADFLSTFDECERQAATFLGGQWADARVDLILQMPNTAQWEGGGRWYRCDVMEVAGKFDVVARRTGSLRDAAKPGAPLLHGCVTIIGLTATSWEHLDPSECGRPHDAEYVGAFKVPGSTRPKDPVGSGLYEQCWDILARYVGGTRGQIQLGRLSTLASQTRWDRGDHHVKCYAWHSKGKLTRTVKGLGNGAPG